MVIVDDIQKFGARNARGMRRLSSEGGVDIVLTVDGQVVVFQGVSRGIVAGLVAGGDGLVPLWRRGGNQELVIEERAAINRVEEVVIDCVLLRELALGQIGRVEI